MLDPRTAEAVELMTRFAQRTGLTGGGMPRRYLWTDAFAVCNLLGLARALGEQRHHELALQLVDQVHRVLGRHRGDDGRTGWLSGLGPDQGEAHPTRGGLRIGKPLPEREPAAPLDERLEWERDGQYFHYLTKWMHALDQVTRATGQPMFNAWARELAAAAHRAFTYPARSGARRMYWKVSIDLSRPLVASMGHHDPLDGFITCAQLDATAAQAQPAAGPSLAHELADFAAMIDPAGLATADPLGLGGVLIDAWRIEQLMRQGAPAAGHGLLDALLAAALAGLQHYLGQAELRSPAHRRLAFRELGLAIGLAAAALLADDLRRAPDLVRSAGAIEHLARYAPVRAEIESFWLLPAHRRAATWIEHEDINDVMLATSLAPEGFLVLAPPAR